MSNLLCSNREDHAPHSWGDLEWCPGIDSDPTDADVPMTNPERDRWRRIVEEQRKDIRDLVRQLEDASRRAAFWETMAEPEETA